MKQQKQHLEILISSQEAKKQQGNLSPTDIAYLDGLKRAKNIVFGQEEPSSPRRQVQICPRCQSSNIREGLQFHNCLSCGNIFT